MIDVTTQGPDGHWDYEDIKRLCEYRDLLRTSVSVAVDALEFAGGFDCEQYDKVLRPSPCGECIPCICRDAAASIRGSLTVERSL